MCAASAPVHSAEDLKDTQLLLLFLAGRSLRHSRRVNGLGLVWTRGGVHVTGLDVDVSVFAKLGKVRAQCRLELLHVDRFLYPTFDLFHRWHASLLVFG